MNNYDKKQKEKIYQLIQSDTYKPMTAEDMIFLLEVPLNERHVFFDILKSLQIEGKIMESKKGKLMLPEDLLTIIGSFFANARGFGFVRPVDSYYEANKMLRHQQMLLGEKKDVFIPEAYTKGAFHGDIVLCELYEGQKPHSLEGKILQIIKREKEVIVGEIKQKSKNRFLVLPDDNKFSPIPIALKNLHGASPGHKVSVSFGANQPAKEVKVTSIIGHKDEPFIDIMSMIVDRQIPYEFSDQVFSEIEYTPAEISSADMENRLDLRGQTIFTIDGEDAKDLDDAVHIKKLPNNQYELGVHIADVSHYVKPNSLVDKEAYKRGNSLYLANGVIPMLPQKLSNGICSLHEHVDRLCLSCIMTVNEHGTVVAHTIAETVIHSQYKMTYDIVNEMIEDLKSPYHQTYQEISPQIQDLYDLSCILDTKRKNRGALNFSFPETKIILNEEGRAIDIIKKTANKATKVIEEAMILCNETVGESYHWLEHPFIYRVHEEMTPENYQALKESMAHLGLSLPGKKENPKTFQKLLDHVQGKPVESMVAHMVLRSMKQAYYSPLNQGHFGLASKFYSHFTAPIRRYADLVIHRIIKDHIHATPTESFYEKNLESITKHVSVTERKAEQLERDVTDMKKVEYMEDKIGESFTGHVSGITHWGVYVELQNTVEGLIPIGKLSDDYYIFDRGKMSLTGESTGRKIYIGTPLKIQVDKANKMMGQLDFSLVKFL